MPRRTDVDVLRGLLLVIMVLSHLPTRLRLYSAQPLGFVSAAEGFVFLSAFAAGGSGSILLVERGLGHVRSRLWARARRVYTYHLALLAFAFTVIATVAAGTARPSLRNLLTFYFDSPAVALVSGPLLLYQPPLLDILPMYVIFMACSPFVLSAAGRYGWRPLVTASSLIWLFAQLGGRAHLHAVACSLSGVKLPLEATGSFDLLAWQLLWVVGLWAGSRRGSGARQRPPLALVGAAALVACGFLLWRHRVGGIWIDLGVGAALLDKWHLGGLRLLNLAALAVVVSQGLLPALGRLRLGALALLGRASLQAFTAHVVLCLLSLGLLVDDDTPLSTLEEVIVLTFTFAAMLLVAWRSTLARAGGYQFAR